MNARPQRPERCALAKLSHIPLQERTLHRRPAVCKLFFKKIFLRSCQVVSVPARRSPGHGGTCFAHIGQLGFDFMKKGDKMHIPVRLPGKNFWLLTRVCLQTLFTKSCYDREMCYYDIPEDLWLRLEPILPTEGSPRGGRPIGDVRNFLNAVHWMLRTGSPWRALPEKYGSWKTVYSRFRRWQKRGYLTAILKLLTLQADMNHIMIDGTYVHAHKHSAGARHTSGINQALGRSRGGFTSKIHAVVDALGNLPAFTVTAGQYSEYPQASNLLIQYHNTTILADKGYDSRSLIDALHQQGCKAVIPSRRTNHHPRTIDRHLYKERHLIETFFNKIKEYRKIATRYDKLAEVFAAFVCLAASLIWLR